MYFLKEYLDKDNHAGSKARKDCENIIREMNGLELDFRLGGRKAYYLGLFKRSSECKRLKKGDFLVIQYPYYGKYHENLYKVISKLRKRGVKVIAIIHDIISLRSSDKSVQEEMIILKNLDVLISHNKKMTKFLRENGVESKIVDLDIFDYLTTINNIKCDNDFKKIYITGNLDPYKAKYIYTEDFRNIKSNINLYGPNFASENLRTDKKNINYIGCFKPEELCNKLGNGFGLIWDGTNINTCDGILGEYLKYNNPHKTSLYLSAGLPVLVWEKAAISDFIKKNKIGIVVSSLKDIDNILDNISFEEYMRMKYNAEKIGEKIIKGEFLKKALKIALE